MPWQQKQVLCRYVDVKDEAKLPYIRNLLGVHIDDTAVYPVLQVHVVNIVQYVSQVALVAGRHAAPTTETHYKILKHFNGNCNETKLISSKRIIQFSYKT